MIITIDVGNTNITVGVFNGDEIVASFRMTTKMPRTSDEYGMLLTNLLEQNRIHCDEIQDAFIYCGLSGGTRRDTECLFLAFN